MDFNELATSYTGERAQSYEAARQNGPDWPIEQSIVDAFLGRLPHGASIIDIPVGTGRFLEFYQKYKLSPTGFDISPDMLSLAKSRAQGLGFEMPLKVGDIRKLDESDKSFDAAVCFRFVNWVEFSGMEAALRELSRVTRTFMIVSIRAWPTPDTPWKKLRQSLTAFRRRHAGLKFHNTQATEDLFRRLGFEIVDNETVQRRSDQTSYSVYFLRRPISIQSTAH